MKKHFLKIIACLAIVSSSLSSCIILEFYSPRTAQAGASFVVSSIIKNNFVDQPLVLIEYVLSSDRFYDPSDLNIGIELINDVAFNEKTTIFKNVTIPQSVFAGDYWIICRTPLSEFALPITITGKQLTGVDFRPINHIWQNDVQYKPIDGKILNIGEAYGFTYEIINAGKTIANTVKAKYYLSKGPSRSESDLAIGSVPIINGLDLGVKKEVTAWVQIPSYLEAGKYEYLLIEVNPGNAVQEEDTNNNILAKRISLKRKNNLQESTSRSNESIITQLDGSPKSTTDLKIYPNPNFGLVTVELSNAISAQIFNLNGQRVRSYQLSESNQLDLQNLDNGFYLIRVQTTSGKILTKEIIIQK